MQRRDDAGRAPRTADAHRPAPAASLLVRGRAGTPRCRLAVNPAEEVRLAAKIVPRWEWRTFGNDFGAAEEALGALAVERVEESDDLYLLFRDGDATVKVRHGLLDVKGLLAVDDDGLEQWVPVAKHPLPGVARRCRRRARQAAGGRAAARPRDLHRRGAPRRGRAADRRAAGRHGAQAAHPLHGRRLHGRDLRAPDRRGLHALARDRVRGSRARDGGRSLARPRARARTCAWSAG